jgi:L-aspartate oxidase
LQFAAKHAGNTDELLRNLQKQMWQNAGLLRDAAGLTAVKQELERARAEIVPTPERASLELVNLCTVAELVVISALARKDSRGAHYRNDFPRRDDARYAKQSVVRSGEVFFEAMEMSALAR